MNYLPPHWFTKRPTAAVAVADAPDDETVPCEAYRGEWSLDSLHIPPPRKSMLHLPARTPKSGTKIPA